MSAADRACSDSTEVVFTNNYLVSGDMLYAGREKHRLDVFIIYPYKALC